MKKIKNGIFLKDSGKKGNTTAIMVGVHGNEISGIKAMDELIDKLEIISGKVYFIYANLKAIEKNVRFTEKNLNRCFLKGKVGKTYEEKRALEIMEILDKCDFLLDVHNTTSFVSSLEFLITTYIDYSKYFLFDKVVCCIDNIQKGSSDGYMDNIGKKGFCIECGSINFGDKEKSKLLAKKSILNFLKLTENIFGKLEIFENKKIIVKMDYMYKTKTNNFKLVKEFKDFEELNAGDLIGIDGEEKIFAEKNSIILFAHDRKKIRDEGFCIGSLKKI